MNDGSEHLAWSIFRTRRLIQRSHKWPRSKRT